MKRLIVFLFVIFFSVPAFSAVFDYGRDWKTITTPHFQIRYHDSLEETAERAANLAEEVHSELSPMLDWKPWGKTEIILLDNTDESNGWASPLPYNWILIYAVPPRAGTFLSHYDDWLKELIAHEYTHILHLDATRSIWRPIKYIFGNMISPAAMTPKWIKEGLAVYDETLLTNAGRDRSTLTDMVVRTAILEGNFPHIDQLEGWSWRWPSYLNAYLVGGKFIEYIIDQYGLDKFLEFNFRIQKSILVTMINHQAKNVYGKTFYELWREWTEYLETKYGRVEDTVLTESSSNLESIAGIANEVLSAPALSKDDKKLVYHFYDPHGPPRLHLRDLETGETAKLQKAKYVTQTSFSNDGKKIVYSALSSWKRYYKYYDLFEYNLETKKNKALTKGKRARDPDYHPKFEEIIFVQNNPLGDYIRLMSLKDKKISTIVDKKTTVRFANPRWSPDGSKFVVTKWQGNWDIVACYADGKKCWNVTNDKSDEFYPSWSKNGKSIYFTSTKTGIPDIRKCNIRGKKCKRVTNVLSGVFWPLEKDKDNLIVQEYHSTGFRISETKTKVFKKADFKIDQKEQKQEWKNSLEYVRRAQEFAHKKAVEKQARMSCRVKTGKWKGSTTPCGNSRQKQVSASKSSKKMRSSGSELSENADDDVELKIHRRAKNVGNVSAPMDLTDSSFQEYKFKKYSGKKYVAFGKSLFLPRYLLPNIALTDDGIFASIQTGGHDPLRWHNWAIGGTYRTDAGFFGYYGTYSYARWPVVFGVGGIDYVANVGRFRVVRNNQNQIIDYFEERRRGYTFLAYPYKKHLFNISYFYEDRFPKTYLTPAEEAVLNTGIYAGLMGRYYFTNIKRYPASISPESGQVVRVTGVITDARLGCKESNEQQIFAADFRQYVPIWRHTVLALRAKGGLSFGDEIVQGNFSLGGALGEGFMAGGGAYNYLPLRGLPVSTFSRDRGLLVSGEYRFPIVSPQRGLGTWPVFLTEMHGAVFADYGDAWSRGQAGKDSIDDFFDDFMLGVGAEIRANFILGHGLPVKGRLGYAIVVVNRDRLAGLTDPLFGQSVDKGILILQLGTMF